MQMSGFFGEIWSILTFFDKMILFSNRKRITSCLFYDAISTMTHVYVEIIWFLVATIFIIQNRTDNIILYHIQHICFNKSIFYFISKQNWYYRIFLIGQMILFSNRKRITSCLFYEAISTMTHVYVEIISLRWGTERSGCVVV
jgi:hypothetical protein